MSQKLIDLLTKQANRQREQIVNPARSVGKAGRTRRFQRYAQKRKEAGWKQKTLWIPPGKAVALVDENEVLEGRVQQGRFMVPEGYVLYKKGEKLLPEGYVALLNESGYDFDGLKKQPVLTIVQKKDKNGNVRGVLGLEVREFDTPQMQPVAC